MIASNVVNRIQLGVSSFYCKYNNSRLGGMERNWEHRDIAEKLYGTERWQTVHFD